MRLRVAKGLPDPGTIETLAGKAAVATYRTSGR
jgi:hypothetical protein